DPVPCVVVNVVPFGDWPLVLARAIAQNLAGVADEYELEGGAFTRPTENVVSPIAPNLVTLDDAARADLAAGKAPAVAAPAAFAAWSIPKAAAVDFVAHPAGAANPIAAWNPVNAGYGLGDFHL